MKTIQNTRDNKDKTLRPPRAQVCEGIVLATGSLAPETQECLQVEAAEVHRLADPLHVAFHAKEVELEELVADAQPAAKQSVKPPQQCNSNINLSSDERANRKCLKLHKF